MIYGYPFIFDKTPSEIYGVSLVFISNSYTNRESGSGVEFITDSIRRNPKVVYLDGQQTPPLEFGVEIVFDDPVDIFVFTQVKDWLGGAINFKELRICADNFAGFYFNCYIELEEDLVYAGGYRGIRGTVHCDAPWAWQDEESVVYEFADTTIPHLIQFNNLSADSEYLRPVIEMTVTTGKPYEGDSNPYTAAIVNTSFLDRKTEFTNLNQGETVELDNLYGFINSYIGTGEDRVNNSLNRVKNFNKVFLKLVKGINNLVVSPNVSRLKITYQNAKRIGGAFY
jgi:hypothetical protein